MAENTDIVLFFENRRSLPPRCVLIEGLLRAVSPWFTEPTELLRLNYRSGEEVREEWGENSLLSAELGETELLFVYANPLNKDAAINSLGITEKDDLAVYTLAIQKSQLLSFPLDAVEAHILNLYRAALAFYPPILYAGSEVEWGEQDRTALQVVNNALDPSNESYWVMGDNRHLTLRPPEFDIAAQIDGHYLLCNRNCLIKHGFDV